MTTFQSLGNKSSSFRLEKTISEIENLKLLELGQHFGQALGPFLGERVVVHVQDGEIGVARESVGEGGNTLVVNTVLWHHHLLQGSHELKHLGQGLGSFVLLTGSAQNKNLNMS